MKLKRILRAKKHGRKNNQPSEYRTIKCLIISLDEEGDSFGDSFFPKMLNISQKECEKCEFEALVEFKRFYFWKGPSMLLYNRAALDQYMMFHKCHVVFLTVSKINQQVETKNLKYVYTISMNRKNC